MKLPALTTREVAELLDEPRSRFDKWISLKLFEPASTPERGGGRRWGIGEVWRLAVFIELIDHMGLRVEAAATIAPRVHAIHRTGATYLVAWQGEAEGVGGVSVIVPGYWFMETMDASGFADLAQRRTVHRLLAINVARILTDLVERWPTKGKAGG